VRSEKITGLMILGLLIGLNGCGSPAKPQVLQVPGAPVPSESGITISPVSAPPGSADLTLTITGSNFDGEGVIQSQVLWSANGNETTLTRTVNSSSRITAAVPATLLTSPVTAQVWVEAFDQIEQTVNSKSNVVTFSVLSHSTGRPVISSISPASATAGSPDLTLTLSGVNFRYTNQSGRQYHEYLEFLVQGSETMLSVSQFTDTQITAVIPAALLVSPVTADVQLQVWYKADDTPTVVSNPVNFSVTP
jgi:hypothetical protein